MTELDLVDRFVSRFLMFPSLAARRAVVLWILHTHAIDCFESTPRLALVSPEKGSGKTRTLEVLDLLVPNPMHAVNCSAAALFRAVSSKRPTLLFDEADTYFGPRSREHEELRGLINAGHRRGAVAYRAEPVGNKIEIREFPAFAATALAAIGDLPDTILDRSVVIRMKRRAPNEVVEPFRYRKVVGAANEIREAVGLWAKEHAQELSELEPDLPEGIVDRPADVWECLIAVGDVCGGDWPLWAREAAVELNAVRSSIDQSLGIRLLADVRSAFADSGIDRLATIDLLDFLNHLDESPWGDLRGKELDSRGLARRLHQYDVGPRQVRFGEQTKKGYMQDDFVDVWGRYLPPHCSETNETGATE